MPIFAALYYLATNSIASMGTHVGFWFFLVFVNFFRLVPFWVLYAFSDLLYYPIRYVVRYRRQTIYGNLRVCFPEKSAKEIDRIAGAFYRHFCDLAVESLKGFTLSKKELMKRFVVSNPELLTAYLQKGIGSISVPAHYNNWEYAALIGIAYVQNTGIIMYKPLSNRLIDAYFRKKRASWGTIFWSIYQTNELFEQVPSLNPPPLVVMMGDQSPTNLQKSHWVNFFGIQTPFLHGPEFYARQRHLPVFYTHIAKVKRGHYVLSFHPLTGPPTAQQPEGSITQLYASALERSIREAPQFWIWSHNKFKHVPEAVKIIKAQK